jgi:putative redox protein
MGVKMRAEYLGNKAMQALHQPSGVQLRTAAPLDNQGDGSSFSPTDLVSTGLLTCMMTIVAIVAEKEGTSLEGTWGEVEKSMTPELPRRIARLQVVIHFPAALDEATRQRFETAALGCPAHRSLHPDVEQDVSFVYDV